MTQPKHTATTPPHSEGSGSAQSSDQEESSFVEPPFTVDQIVWVKVKGHTIWPGTVSSLPSISDFHRLKKFRLIARDPATHVSSSITTPVRKCPSVASMTSFKHTRNGSRNPSSWARRIERLLKH